MEGLPEEDKDILGAAAAFHDSRRQDDWLDVGHGQRAADYYREYCVSHELEFKQKCYGKGCRMAKNFRADFYIPEK